MIRRNYDHNSPMVIPKNLWDYLTLSELNTNIDRDSAMVELFQRCPECRKRFHEKVHGEFIEYYFENDLNQLLEIEYKREKVRDINKKAKERKKAKEVIKFPKLYPINMETIPIEFFDAHDTSDFVI
jgi:hypothetical protein